MKVTVIGHWGAFPEAGEATSGYLFQHEDYNLLIDCGSGVVSNLQRFIPLEDLDAVVLSHYHADHFCDIGVLQYARLIKTDRGQVSKSLLIYGHSGDPAFHKLTKKRYTLGKAYREKDILRLGPFQISFCRTQHPIPCYAMRISAGNQCVVYSADTAAFPAMAGFAAKADLLIGECSLYDDMDGKSVGHMNSADVGKFARKADVKQLLLTHLPHWGDPARLLESAGAYFKGTIALAALGWTWEGGK
ncbi:MAG: MBL fold metallo-hydrolase [Firmicutes bacterium]|nr:MBL fold metallo-hydrolase [Bacillota bacterium]